MRRDLERQIIVIREECGGWKKKYENEARLRIEDVDMLKKKFGAQVADLSDQVNQLVNKIKQMEQQKTRDIIFRLNVRKLRLSFDNTIQYSRI